jgi:hypothetical protein
MMEDHYRQHAAVAEDQREIFIILVIIKVLLK